MADLLVAKVAPNGSQKAKENRERDENRLINKKKAKRTDKTGPHVRDK